MFGRGKASTAPRAIPHAEVTSSGKGRPTPKRRVAEQANRRPLVGTPRAISGTKAERRAARRAQQEASRAERGRMRAALQSGDERHLPARDRGPARRWARDYVDARRNIGEYFLAAALAAVVVSLVNTPLTTTISMAVLYGMVLVVGIDSFLLRRRVQRLTTVKFGATESNGVGTYAMMRTLQIRRARLPRPRVKRGQFPS